MLVRVFAQAFLNRKGWKFERKKRPQTEIGNFSRLSNNEYTHVIPSQCRTSFG